MSTSLTYRNQTELNRDAIARKIEVQKSQLRQFEARIWKFIRSIQGDLYETVRQRRQEMKEILTERNRLAWRLNYLRVFEIPHLLGEVVQWIQTAIDSNRLYSGSITRPTSPDQPQPIEYRPPPTPEPITQSSMASQPRDWSPEPSTAHLGPSNSFPGLLTRPSTPNPSSQVSGPSQASDWTPQESLVESDPYDRYQPTPPDPNLIPDEESVERTSETHSSMPSLEGGANKSKSKTTSSSSPPARHQRSIDQESGNLTNHMYKWMRHFHGGNPVPLSQSYMLREPMSSPPSS